ncbi:GNAT family N-acetyltransferase [Sporomusa aerivorans]|uniref:GNAT family N-acetyltransferase n=1 Tax=Sporomusa aerivorans TaxID=204936 RepID=UPI00352A21FE
MDLIYKPINADQDLTDSIIVIRNSFATVAGEFNLTPDNAPTNPAFIEVRHLKRMREKGIVMFGVFHDESQVGFVAVEKKAENEFYMERLAVLPEYRHKGYGRKIVEHVSAYVAGQGGGRVLIGMIDEHVLLKAWYCSLGFKEQHVARHVHLPFAVCYMEKIL